jgi:hypothetical protein
MAKSKSQSNVASSAQKSALVDDSCSSDERSIGFAEAIGRIYKRGKQNPQEDPKTPKGRKRSSSPKPPQTHKKSKAE